MARRRILIAGAAGRDFHNFNMVYRDDRDSEVVTFTAAQIPGISGRRYPPLLAGPLYPEGIPIEDEARLDEICRREHIDTVVFAYSDVSHETVMHLASRTLAAGADFLLLGPERTMIRSSRPVIAVSAIRTGCGKSQVARWIGRWLQAQGWRPAILRHPMPYGCLKQSAVQRFASLSDLDAAHCTIEEREEYEPHLAAGNVVFAGVDYTLVVERAQQEADILVWDGGNNDFPFLRPDLHIVLVDALRPGQAAAFHPGETVLRMADVVIVNKVDAASPSGLAQVLEEVRTIRPHCAVLQAPSPVSLDMAVPVEGRRTLVVEDGPTMTHGGMAYGAGYVVATRAGAIVVDPRHHASPGLREVYRAYPHLGPVLPAVGYSPEQLRELEETIAATDAEVVVLATPSDLTTLIRIEKPVARVRYEFADTAEPGLAELLSRFLRDTEVQPGR